MRGGWVKLCMSRARRPWATRWDRASVVTVTGPAGGPYAIRKSFQELLWKCKRRVAVTVPPSESLADAAGRRVTVPGPASAKCQWETCKIWISAYFALFIAYFCILLLHTFACHGWATWVHIFTYVCIFFCIFCILTVFDTYFCIFSCLFLHCLHFETIFLHFFWILLAYFCQILAY